MLSIDEQLRTQKLACPRTRSPLVRRGDHLETADGEVSYPLIGGVPILLADPEGVAAELARQDGAMVAEYARPARAPFLRRMAAALTARVGDQRSPESLAAFAAIFESLPPDALCLSVGGGPTRAHPRLVNLNLGAFPGVEVVADAYALPYGKASVDAIHCEAVLEHLEFPDRAVAEMYRVLAPGRQVFAATPFLQAYHGYPDHYQNFTLSGHRRLFERAGFQVLAAGSCVGPAFVLRDLALNAVRHLLPGSFFAKATARALELLTLPWLFVDRFAGRRPAASHVASTTYVQAVKPAPSE